MEGQKSYPPGVDAARYAAAFDREDSEAVGRRPLLSLIPLGVARRLRRP
jgi:hypothetical protein